MDKLTLLTHKQLYSSNITNRLDIINKIGPKAAITDFSILLGGAITEFYNNEGKKICNRAGMYWTQTKDRYRYGCDKFVIIHNCGSAHIHDRKIGARPVLQYSLISTATISKIKRQTGALKEILEIEYGEYPQWIPSYEYQSKLENAYQKNTITKLTDYIITDSREYNDYDKGFKPQKHPIYKYEEKKYIRIKARPCTYNFRASNKKNYKRGEYVWVEISPVKWLVDEKADIAISKNILFAGVQFKKDSYYDEDFSKTDINWFMNNYLINDLLKYTNIVQTSNSQTKDQLLKEIKILKEQLEVATRKNRELENENTNYKQRIRRIEDITKE